MYKLIYGILFVFSIHSYGKIVSTTSTNSVASIDIPITANIILPTCSINEFSSGGLSQTVDMGFYTIQKIITGNTKNTNVPIIINCAGAIGVKGIALSFSTLGNYGAVGYSQLGAIKTTLKGVSILLTWKIDNELVDLSEGVSKFLPNNNSNIIDASINAKLLSIPGFSLNTIGKGYFRSGINISIHYY
jgi:type 1 fimbria pilin